MYETLSAPILVNWEVTQFCNHNCLHCYNYWRTEVIKEKYPENYKQIYKNVTKELIRNKVFIVTITGGEPLAVFEKIIPFIKKLSNAGIWVVLNSNLTLLTPKRAKKLKEAGIKSILVSLPSADPKTCDKITGIKNSLKSIIKGIKIAQEMNFQIFINMVVSRINNNHIKKTAELVSSMRIKHFSATKASDPSSKREFNQYILNHEEFRKMQENLEEIKKSLSLKTNSLEANPVCAYGNIKPTQGYKFCNAGKTVCTISPEGEIRPCNRIVETYGNIVDGLKNSWFKMEDWRSNKWIPDECSDCKIKFICNGGCKSDAVKAYGDRKKPDPLYDHKYVLKEKQKNQSKLTERKRFRINPNLKVRSEKFGAILFSLPGNWLPVNHELLELFIKNSGKFITINMIEKSLNVNKNDALFTATTLIQKKLLL